MAQKATILSRRGLKTIPAESFDDYLRYYKQTGYRVTADEIDEQGRRVDLLDDNRHTVVMRILDEEGK